MSVQGIVFKCGNCGAALPQVAPGQVVTCPYCNTQQVFPMPTAGLTEVKGTVIVHGGMQISGGGLVIQGGGLVIKGGGAVPDAASNEFLKCSMNDAAWTFEPSMGLVVAGLHGDDEQPGRKLRAIEAYAKQVLWETDAGFPKLDSEHLAIRAGRLYAAGDGALHCRDLRSGQLLWQARLPDDVEGHWYRGMHLVDPYPAEAPQGAIVVETSDEKVTCLDRATGAIRWTVERGDSWRELERSPSGVGAVVAEGSGCVEVHDLARGPEPVSRTHGGDRRWQVLGNTVVIAAEETVAVIELPTGRTLFQGGLHSDMCSEYCGVPVLSGGLVWVANYEDLSGHPKGRRIQGALMPGHKIRALGSTGDTLLALLSKDPGTPKQAVCAFDPATLAPRYAQQELGKYDDDLWGPEDERQIRTSGPFGLVVGKGADDADGDDTTDVHGLDARTGAVAWKHNLPGETVDLGVVQGWFAVRIRHQILLFRPDNGEILAKFPWKK